MLPDFRIRQRDYLLEIARAMSQELNLDKLLARIVHISAEMLAGQAGLIALRREKGGWGVATAHGIPASFLRYLNVLMAQVQPHEDPTRFELPEINQLLQEITRSTSLGLLVGVGLPLIAFDRLIGVIYIFRGYLDIFSANDRALLQSFADQAAIAVHNAQLYTQVSQEKKRMDALLDTVADGMLILAPSHVVERCNPALEHMLGIQKEKIIGSHHEEIIRWKKHNQGMTLEQAEAGGWPLDLERANG